MKLLIGAGSLTALLLLIILLATVMRPTHEEAELTLEQPDLDIVIEPEETQKDEPSEPVADVNPPKSVRMSAETHAIDSPEEIWGSHTVFMTEAQKDYELLDRRDGFAKIRNGEQVGWVPEWYILHGHSIFVVNPYEVLIKQPTSFLLYPEDGAYKSFELQEGTVVQIQKEYGDWVGIDLMLYAEPMEGDKWIRKTDITNYSSDKAKEGYAWNNRIGLVLYDENGEMMQYSHYPLPARIEGETDSMYQIIAPGGINNYIRKSDFLPNPFAEIGLEMNLPMQSYAWDLYRSYKASPDETLLTRLDPVDIFQMYFYAKMTDDFEMLYALFLKDNGIAFPSYEDFARDQQTKSPSVRKEELDFIDHLVTTELDQLLVSDDEAVVQPADPAVADWTFHFTKNTDGAWKVNWLPLQ